MKNIDSYFKNKLDTPKSPPEGAWDYIKAKLPPEDDDRLIPFWKRISGLSLLLIGLTTVGLGIGGYHLFNSHSAQPNQENPIQHQRLNLTNENSETISSGNLVYQKNNSNTDPQTPTNDFNYTTSKLNVRNQNTNNRFEIQSSVTFASKKEISDNYLNDSQLPNLVENSLFGLLNKGKLKLSNQNNFSKFNLAETDGILGQLNKHQDKLEKNQENSSNVKSKNKKLKFDTDFDRFYLSGFISPTSLNTFVGASMLSDDLNNYKTENSITLAYGLKAAYALNPKFKVRTGFSVVGFEQITKSVWLSTGLSVDGQGGVAENNIANNIKYTGDLRIYKPGELDETSHRVSDGDVQQQSQFIEIPVEAEFSVFQTGSIGVSVTGGGSAWLLSKNKIFAHTDGRTEELGRADNLNKASFSVNAGLKFDMKLTEDIQLNVEPGFKYLMNPVKNIKEYSPYTVGVNAGVTIRLK